jgi:hypothetical protein
MYKHAFYRRTDRDEPDPNEILDAAGIKPRANINFVREVKFAVQKGRKETKNYSELARYLNSRNISNARGYSWTHRSIKAFVEYYVATRQPQSN